jgi:hypothetical protein
LVAGYTSAVFLFDPKKDERKNEPFPERLEGRRVGSKSFVQTEPASSLMRPAGDAPALNDYAIRKIVFIFKNKAWTLGKLSEYTDNAELRSALSVNKL